MNAPHPIVRRLPRPVLVNGFFACCRHRAGRGSLHPDRRYRRLRTPFEHQTPTFARHAALLVLVLTTIGGPTSGFALTSETHVTYFVSAKVTDGPGTLPADTAAVFDAASFARTAMRGPVVHPASATAMQSSTFDSLDDFRQLHTEGTATAYATDDQPFTAAQAESETKIEMTFVLEEMATLRIRGTVSGFTSAGSSSATGSVNVGKIGTPTLQIFSSSGVTLGQLDASMVLRPGTYGIGARATATAAEGPVPDPTGFFDLDITLEPHPCGEPGAILGTSNDDPALAGTEGDDVLCGLEGNDTIRGFGGNDRIYGGPALLSQQGLFGSTGNDTLYGGTGNDKLHGEDGKDRLFGDDGADRLFGGPGKDRVHGGTGRDVVDGGAGKDRLYGEDGNDRIYSRDAATDTMIDGGPGNDRAQVDPSDPLTSIETLLP